MNKIAIQINPPEALVKKADASIERGVVNSRATYGLRAFEFLTRLLDDGTVVVQNGEVKFVKMPKLSA